MTINRSVNRVVRGKPTMDGAGVKLTRVLGSPDVGDIDPFLMLDAFDSTNMEDYMRGFPMHPHRGIETFTYLIEGAMDHRDTLGNAGRISGGEAQWMNAGSGILHEEMPVASPRLRGLQLWINLPAAHKMTAPTYRDLAAKDMPVLRLDGATLRVAAGEYQGAQGPKGRFVAPTILDIALDPRAGLTIQLNPEETAFLYALEGGAAVGEPGTPIEARSAALLTAGHRLALQAGADGARLVLFAGAPLREPIAWGGPIVMNTQAQLAQAFRELDQGTFVKKQ